MKHLSVYDCPLVELPLTHHKKGNLTAVENGTTVPFDVRRVFYLYDVPAGGSRGGHAHVQLQQLIVAASGSFDVILSDGQVRRTITLNRPFRGLLVGPGIWSELENFSSGSVCLVLASKEYDESDYVRDYKQFLKWRAA